MAEPHLKDFDGDVIVCCGDAPLIRPETFRGLIDHCREKQSKAAVLSAIIDDPKGYGRIIRADNGSVHIIEDKDCTEEQRRTNEVNAGTYCFDCRLLFETLPKVNNDNAQGEYYLPDVPKIMDADGHKVTAVVLEDWREMIGINSRIHLAEASEILQERIQRRHMAAGVTLVDPRTIYIEKKVRIGRDSVIMPFTALRGRTVIGEGCQIRPFADLLDLEVQAESEVKG
jgi:bifunctional UDP-N-acetylglucosamine pyrophosphorylase/glucosamine-1-phosphate N-acetyltransferase